MPEFDAACTVLKTSPQPGRGVVLVTGATGYIGGRLIPELIGRGYRVRAMLRAKLTGHEERWPGVETAVADASDPVALRAAMEGVHTAYYLIHSLLLGPSEFEAADRNNARNFREAAEAAGVKNIIYLGGLGDVRTSLSAHLRSRMQVAEELSAGSIPVTVVRAAIIIGSGSASYEIIYHLVRNLPVIPVPAWSRTRCQPIAIRDVIRYLVGVMEQPECAGLSFDVGGTEVFTYERMLRGLAQVLGRRIVFVNLPRCLSPVRPYAYLAGFLTPVAMPITRSLMESLKNDVVCLDDRVRRLVPFQTMTYKEAVLEALSREERDEIHTRWSDSYPPAHELAIKFRELSAVPHYKTSYSLLSEKKPEALFTSICRIGGQEGWFHGNWMWRLRGILDTVLMGVGSTRGRRSRTRLRVNDVIDFWRVEELARNRWVLLRAEMRLPGRAWLEFRIDPAGASQRLSVTAYFDTDTLFGRLYWYFFLPFHWYIFDNLIRQIEKRG